MNLLITFMLKMKRAVKNVSFVILLLKSLLLLSQKPDVGTVVVIDPGHEGKDSGAIGVNGIEEKKVVLNVAKAILELNKRSESPLDIYLTRYSDTLISLSDRSKLAKALKADVFLSLHCNHSDNPKARGIEVYLANFISKSADDSIWLAYQLQSEFSDKLGFESRGVKFAGFQVLQATSSYGVTVLLEIGFLSNGDESGYYGNSNSSHIVALVILESLNGCLNH